MSTYVMSDIHGNLFAFSSMLKQINFSKKDKLIILGDIIDRGRYSLELLQYAKETENVEMLMGNHEAMMLKYFRSNLQSDKDIWFLNGGNSTLNQIERNFNQEEQDDLMNWVSNLPYIVNVEAGGRSFVLCHANPLAKSNHDMVWDRIYPKKSNLTFKENKIYIVGHTPVNAYINTEKAVAKWCYDNRVLNIDCGCAYIGDLNSQLCCVRLDDMELFYVDCNY